MGPAKSVRCSNCDAKISVSWMTGLIGAVLLLFHFLVIFFVGLEIWSRYGILAAFAGILLVSAPFFVLFGVIQHRIVKLVERDA